MHVRSTGCQPIACRPQAPQFPLSMTNRCELPGISKYYYSVINRDESLSRVRIIFYGVSCPDKFFSNLEYEFGKELYRVI